MSGRKKRTTIQDIARALDITPSAVSKALNDHPRISERTKKAVVEKARELNYQPNTLASALRSGRSHLLGVMVPRIDYSFFSSVVRGIEEAAYKAGYQVIICQSHDAEKTEMTNLETLVKSQVDGILISIANTTIHLDHLKDVIAKGIPLIFFDRVRTELGTSTVRIDDFLGARMAVEHLIGQGCRQIVHLAGFSRVELYQQRIQGYRDALVRAGLPVDENLILESDLSRESGFQRIHQFLTRGGRLDGIFAASDHAALGAMQVLQSKGLRIPEEVAVVGFSNESFSDFIYPPLTTVDQQSLQMGHLAAQLFLESLEKNATTRNAILKPKLIVRASSLRHQP